MFLFIKILLNYLIVLLRVLNSFKTRNIGFINFFIKVITNRSLKKKSYDDINKNSNEKNKTNFFFKTNKNSYSFVPTIFDYMFYNNYLLKLWYFIIRLRNDIDFKEFVRIQRNLNFNESKSKFNFYTISKNKSQYITIENLNLNYNLNNRVLNPLKFDNYFKTNDNLKKNPKIFFQRKKIFPNVLNNQTSLQYNQDDKLIGFLGYLNFFRKKKDRITLSKLRRLYDGERHLAKKMFRKNEEKKWLIFLKNLNNPYLGKFSSTNAFNKNDLSNRNIKSVVRRLSNYNTLQDIKSLEHFKFSVGFLNCNLNVSEGFEENVDMPEGNFLGRFYIINPFLVLSFLIYSFIELFLFGYIVSYFFGSPFDFFYIISKYPSYQYFVFFSQYSSLLFIFASFGLWFFIFLSFSLHVYQLIDEGYFKPLKLSWLFSNLYGHLIVFLWCYFFVSFFSDNLSFLNIVIKEILILPNTSFPEFYFIINIFSQIFSNFFYLISQTDYLSFFFYNYNSLKINKPLEIFYSDLNFLNLRIPFLNDSILSEYQKFNLFFYFFKLLYYFLSIDNNFNESFIYSFYDYHNLFKRELIQDLRKYNYLRTKFYYIDQIGEIFKRGFNGSNYRLDFKYSTDFIKAKDQVVFFDWHSYRPYSQLSERNQSDEGNENPLYYLQPSSLMNESSQFFFKPSYTMSSYSKLTNFLLNKNFDKNDLFTFNASSKILNHNYNFFNFTFDKFFSTIFNIDQLQDISQDFEENDLFSLFSTERSYVKSLISFLEEEENYSNDLLPFFFSIPSFNENNLNLFSSNHIYIDFKNCIKNNQKSQKNIVDNHPFFWFLKHNYINDINKENNVFDFSDYIITKKQTFLWFLNKDEDVFKYSFEKSKKNDVFLTPKSFSSYYLMDSKIQNWSNFINVFWNQYYHFYYKRSFCSEGNGVSFNLSKGFLNSKDLAVYNIFLGKGSLTKNRVGQYLHSYIPWISYKFKWLIHPTSTYKRFDSFRHYQHHQNKNFYFASLLKFYQVNLFKWQIQSNYFNWSIVQRRNFLLNLFFKKQNDLIFFNKLNYFLKNDNLIKNNVFSYRVIAPIITTKDFRFYQYVTDVRRFLGLQLPVVKNWKYSSYIRYLGPILYKKDISTLMGFFAPFEYRNQIFTSKLRKDSLRISVFYPIKNNRTTLKYAFDSPKSSRHRRLLSKSWNKGGSWLKFIVPQDVFLRKYGKKRRYLSLLYSYNFSGIGRLPVLYRSFFQMLFFRNKIEDFKNLKIRFIKLQLSSFSNKASDSSKEHNFVFWNIFLKKQRYNIFVNQSNFASSKLDPFNSFLNNKIGFLACFNDYKNANVIVLKEQYKNIKAYNRYFFFKNINIYNFLNEDARLKNTEIKKLRFFSFIRMLNLYEYLTYVTLIISFKEMNLIFDYQKYQDDFKCLVKYPKFSFSHNYFKFLYTANNYSNIHSTHFYPFRKISVSPDASFVINANFNNFKNIWSRSPLYFAKRKSEFLHYLIEYGQGYKNFLFKNSKAENIFGYCFYPWGLNTYSRIFLPKNFYPSMFSKYDNINWEWNNSWEILENEWDKPGENSTRLNDLKKENLKVYNSFISESNVEIIEELLDYYEEEHYFTNWIALYNDYFNDLENFYFSFKNSLMDFFIQKLKADRSSDIPPKIFSLITRKMKKKNTFFSIDQRLLFKVLCMQAFNHFYDTFFDIHFLYLPRFVDIEHYQNTNNIFSYFFGLKLNLTNSSLYDFLLNVFYKIFVKKSLYIPVFDFYPIVQGFPTKKDPYTSTTIPWPFHWTYWLDLRYYYYKWFIGIESKTTVFTSFIEEPHFFYENNDSFWLYSFFVNLFESKDFSYELPVYFLQKKYSSFNKSHFFYLNIFFKVNQFFEDVFHNTKFNYDYDNYQTYHQIYYETFDSFLTYIYYLKNLYTISYDFYSITFSNKLTNSFVDFGLSFFQKLYIKKDFVNYFQLLPTMIERNNNNLSRFYSSNHFKNKVYFLKNRPYILNDYPVFKKSLDINSSNLCYLDFFIQFHNFNNSKTKNFQKYLIALNILSSKISLKKEWLNDFEIFSLNYSSFKNILNNNFNNNLSFFNESFSNYLYFRLYQGSFRHHLHWFFYPVAYFNYFFKPYSFFESINNFLCFYFFSKNDLFLFFNNNSSNLYYHDTVYGFFKSKPLNFFQNLYGSEMSSLNLQNFLLKCFFENNKFSYKNFSKKHLNSDFFFYFLSQNNYLYFLNHFRFENSLFNNFCQDFENFQNNFHKNSLSFDGGSSHQNNSAFLKMQNIFTYREYEKYKRQHHRQRFRSILPLWIQNVAQYKPSKRTVGGLPSYKTTAHFPRRNTEFFKRFHKLNAYKSNKPLQKFWNQNILFNSLMFYSPSNQKIRYKPKSLWFVPYKYSKWYTHNSRLSFFIDPEILNLYSNNQIEEFKYIYIQSLFLLKRKIMYDIVNLKLLNHKQHLLYFYLINNENAFNDNDNVFGIAKISDLLFTQFVNFFKLLNYNSKILFSNLVYISDVFLSNILFNYNKLYLYDNLFNFYSVLKFYHYDLFFSKEKDKFVFSNDSNKKLEKLIYFSSKKLYTDISFSGRFKKKRYVFSSKNSYGLSTRLKPHFFNNVLKFSFLFGNEYPSSQKKSIFPRRFKGNSAHQKKIFSFFKKSPLFWNNLNYLNKDIDSSFYTGLGVNIENSFFYRYKKVSSIWRYRPFLVKSPKIPFKIKNPFVFYKKGFTLSYFENSLINTRRRHFTDSFFFVLFNKGNFSNSLYFNNNLFTSSDFIKLSSKLKNFVFLNKFKNFSLKNNIFFSNNFSKTVVFKYYDFISRDIQKSFFFDDPYKNRNMNRLLKRQRLRLKWKERVSFYLYRNTNWKNFLHSSDFSDIVGHRRYKLDPVFDFVSKKNTSQGNPLFYNNSFFFNTVFFSVPNFLSFFIPSKTINLSNYYTNLSTSQLNKNYLSGLFMDNFPISKHTSFFYRNFRSLNNFSSFVNYDFFLPSSNFIYLSKQLLSIFYRKYPFYGTNKFGYSSYLSTFTLLDSYKINDYFLSSIMSKNNFVYTNLIEIQMNESESFLYKKFFSPFFEKFFLTSNTKNESSMEVLEKTLLAGWLFTDDWMHDGDGEDNEDNTDSFNYINPLFTSVELYSESPVLEVKGYFSNKLNTRAKDIYQQKFLSPSSINPLSRPIDPVFSEDMNIHKKFLFSFLDKKDYQNIKIYNYPSRLFVSSNYVPFFDNNQTIDLEVYELPIRFARYCWFHAQYSKILVSPFSFFKNLFFFFDDKRFFFNNFGESYLSDSYMSISKYTPFGFFLNEDFYGSSFFLKSYLRPNMKLFYDYNGFKKRINFDLILTNNENNSNLVKNRKIFFLKRDFLSFLNLKDKKKDDVKFLENSEFQFFNFFFSFFFLLKYFFKYSFFVILINFLIYYVKIFIIIIDIFSNCFFNFLFFIKLFFFKISLYEVSFYINVNQKILFFFHIFSFIKLFDFLQFKDFVFNVDYYFFCFFIFLLSRFFFIYSIKKYYSRQIMNNKNFPKYFNLSDNVSPKFLKYNFNRNSMLHLRKKAYSEINKEILQIQKQNKIAVSSKFVKLGLLEEVRDDNRKISAKSLVFNKKINPSIPFSSNDKTKINLKKFFLTFKDKSPLLSFVPTYTDFYEQDDYFVYNIGNVYPFSSKKFKFKNNELFYKIKNKNLNSKSLNDHFLYLKWRSDLKSFQLNNQIEYVSRNAEVFYKLKLPFSFYKKNNYYNFIHTFSKINLQKSFWKIPNQNYVLIPINTKIPDNYDEFLLYLNKNCFDFKNNTLDALNLNNQKNYYYLKNVWSQLKYLSDFSAPNYLESRNTPDSFFFNVNENNDLFFNVRKFRSSKNFDKLTFKFFTNSKFWQFQNKPLFKNVLDPSPTNLPFSKYISDLNFMSRLRFTFSLYGWLFNEFLLFILFIFLILLFFVIFLIFFFIFL